MRWFKEKEFACRCCGELPPFARENIEALVRNVLDPVREKLGRPIVVNSGYRCEKHNKDVGGVRNSQHMKGEAADIAPAGFKSSSVPEFKSELERLKQLIVENGKFDQLITYPTFLHVSFKRTGGNRHQVLRQAQHKAKGGAGYELD